jgi:PAS domain S-box-containing protein
MRNRRVRGDIAYGSAMFRSVIESSPLAIITMDLEARVQLWNPAAESILGYPAATALGAPHPVMTPDKKDEMHALFKLVLQGHAFSGVTMRRTRKDGAPVDLSLAMAPLYDEDNRICGVMQVLSDLTEQKRQEEHKRLLEDKILEARKMEAVGRMAAGITHDFNNLLTVILGNVDMLLADMDSTNPAFSVLKEIEQASRSAAELTGRMLVFSRRNKPAATVVSLGRVVRGLQKMVARLLGESIALHVNVARKSGNIRADASQLEQVVMNLVSNAKTAMPDGGHLTLEVADAELGEAFCKTRPDVMPGAYVRLTVRDTGRGIPRAVMTRLFEPFVTTSSAGAHAGLGLSIVWAIVKTHQGVIDVESEPGKGTAFHIHFPRTDEDGEPVSTDAAQIPRGSETILVVDDDPDLLQVVALNLGRLGYTVLQAQGGVEALASARAHAGPIHLLFTDVVMPALGGSDLFEKLRTERPDIRVLFSSGYSDHALLARCQAISDAAFLPKPYTVQQVAGKIRECLDRP